MVVQTKPENIQTEVVDELNTPNQIPLKHRMEEMQPTSIIAIPEDIAQSSGVTPRKSADQDPAKEMSSRSNVLSKFPLSGLKNTDVLPTDVGEETAQVVVIKKLST